VSRARVTAVLVKPARGEPMRSLDRAEVRAAHGLVSDCHAQPLGPRQVLLVLQEDVETLRLQPEQVRANVAVAGLARSDLASGVEVGLGSQVRVRVTHECEVCGQLRRYVRGESSRSLPGRRGWLGVVLAGGKLGVGDPVRVCPDRHPAVPNGIYDRLAWVVARIPRGRVLTYDVLLTLVGASRPYCRVLPRYLHRADAAGLPAHRVLTTAGAPTGAVGDQARRLALEGVLDVGAALADCRWDPRHLYLER